MRPGAHAVDRPLGVPVFVADGDAEAAVVGPDEVDHVTGVTLHVEGRALAGVRRSVTRPLAISHRSESLRGGQEESGEDDDDQAETNVAGATAGGGGRQEGQGEGAPLPPWHTTPHHDYPGPAFPTIPLSRTYPSRRKKIPD